MTNKLEQQADLLFANINGWEQSVLERIGKRINKIGKMSEQEAEEYNSKKETEKLLKEIAILLYLLINSNAQTIQKIYDLQFSEWEENVDYSFSEETIKKELRTETKKHAKQTLKEFLSICAIKKLLIVDKNGNAVSFKKGISEALTEAAMTVKSKTADFNTSMQRIIQNIGKNGIRIKLGENITMRLSNALKQSLFSNIKQANNVFCEYIIKELSCDGYEIDYHSNARPSHRFMQGKQYCIGKTKTINGKTFVGFEEIDPTSPDGLSAAKALTDYNCKHYRIPIICGKSRPTYSNKELAELKARDERTFNIDGHEMTGYEASQAMRRLETAVREQKGINAMAQASGDTLAVRECNERIKRYKDKYAEISDITGIAQDKKRMTLTKGADSGIIKAEKEFSPRKNKTADYSVKWDKVQTSEYENKFSQLSDNEKVVTSAKTRANWCLNNRDGENTEEIYAVSLKDGREIGRITDQVEEYGVVRTKAFDTALKNADEANENILLLHNHPRGLPPSISDINALMKNKNVSGVTIGHDGSVYYYTRPNSEITYTDYTISLMKYSKYSEITSIEKALFDLQEKYGFTIRKL